jgi:hypothetical protein
MAVLNRDQILQKQDHPTEVVSVPEWGGDVIVRGMTAGQRIALSEKTAAFRGVDMEKNEDPELARKMLEVQAEIVCCAAVAEDGSYLFGPDDVAWLKDKNLSVIKRLATTSLRLSGMDADSADEAVKNS